MNNLKPHFNRLYPFFLGISQVKRLLSYKTYLQVVPLLLGILELRSIKKMDKSFIPLFLLIPSAIAVLFFEGSIDLQSVARLAQLTCLILFSSFIQTNMTISQLKKLLFSVEVLSISTVFLELICPFEKMTPNFIFPFIDRLHLIVGEPNFSALLLFGCFSLRLYLREFKRSILLVILIILTGSKTGLVSVLLAVFYFIFSNLQPKFFKYFSLMVLVTLLSYPFFNYFVINKATNTTTKENLIKLTTNRYYIHLLYTQIALDKPAGIGYTKAHPYYQKNFYHLKEKTIPNVEIRDPDLNEQHSFYIHALSELGFQGYLLISFFILLVYKRIFEEPKKQALLISIMTFIIFLNSQNEMILWLIFGFLLKPQSEPSRI